jgi:hypothetical protein
MADRPKVKPHSDHASGTYSKNSKGAPTEAGDAAAAKHENRFAEVTRKSREARDRLNANTQERAERRELTERDRDYTRRDADPNADADERAAAEGEHPAPYAGGRSAVRGQRPATAIERAAALLDGEDPAPDEGSE